MGENPKKYHVTDDGDVYRINEDGSFTSMGNAEKMSSTAQIDATTPTSPKLTDNDKPIKPFVKKKHQGFFIGVITLIFLLGGTSLFYLLHNPEASIISKEEIPSTDTLFQSISDSPLTESEQPIAEEQSGKIHDRPKKEVAKVETNQSERIEPHKESENYAKSSNDVENKIISQDIIDPNKVYSAVDVQAEFPGGDRARLQWLRDHISWPRDVNGHQLHGDVELDFIIERDGSVSNVKVTYSDNSELNSSAITLISSMPKWSAAMVNNQPVRSPMGITLFF